MRRVVRLTESDLARIVKRVINEQYDDSWFTAIQGMVTAVNAKLPAGTPKLIAEAPRPHPQSPESSIADVSVDFKSLGYPNNGTLLSFNILRQKSGLVTSVNASVRNPIGEGMVFQSPKTMDPTTKKLTVGPGGDLTTGVLFTLGTELMKTPIKGIQLLGSALKGQKSKDVKTGVATDLSSIPTDIVKSFNDVKKSIHTMVKPLA